MFVFPIPQMFARQPVVFDVIHQFQLPDRGARLYKEQGKAGPSSDQKRQNQHRTLQGPIPPKRVGAVMPGQILARQFGLFGGKGRMKPLFQHTRVKAMEPFVIARGHCVARGANIAVMHQQMF